MLALARLFAWDSRGSLVILNAFTPFIYLPAWFVAVAAGAARKWLLLGAAVLIAVAHVCFALPELAAAEDVPAAARTAPTFRVFTANVFIRNPDFSNYADEIRRARPDVLILQESAPALVDFLDSSGVLADLPYRVAVPLSNPFGAFLASRWPLTESSIVVLQTRPIAIRATIDVSGTPVSIYGVHAVSPVGANRREEWIADLDHLGSLAAAERHPTVLAGDFNATWGHRAFRRLLDTGLTDGAAARGKAYQMTWTRGRPLPHLVRIDHVLTSPGLAVTRIELGKGTGSDHRPLIADIAVL